MNTKLFLLLALVFPMFATVSCGGAEGGLDTAKMTAEAGDALKSVTEGLTGLADMSDVSKITEKVKGLIPSVDTLAGLKDKLGDKMPSLSGLSGAVDAIKAKFADNAGIMSALEPLMAKLKGLMG